MRSKNTKQNLQLGSQFNSARFNLCKDFADSDIQPIRLFLKHLQ